VPFGAQGSKISAGRGAAGDGDKGGTSGFSFQRRQCLADDLAQTALQAIADWGTSNGLGHNDAGHQFNRLWLV
jgi:hypothetical protein